MSEAPVLSVELIMSSGLKRISAIADKHGINSPETLAACERWGGILDDINYPDDTCRWCGHPVTHTWDDSPEGVWYHVDTKKNTCWESSPAVATPAKKPAPRKVIKK